METVPEVMNRLLASKQLKSTQVHRQIEKLGRIFLPYTLFRDHWFDKFTPTKIDVDELIIVLESLHNFQTCEIDDAFLIISHLAFSSTQLKEVFEKMEGIFGMESGDLSVAYEKFLDLPRNDNMHFSKYLPVATYTQLWGLEESKVGECNDEEIISSASLSTQVINYIIQQKGSYIINIEGIGGIGKTSAVHKIMVRLGKEYRDVFSKLCWVRIDSLDPIQWKTISPIEMEQRIERTFNALCDQVGLSDAVRLPLSRKIIKLQEVFKMKPYIVVIDNLQSPSDLEELSPYIRPLANPTWFILTCRGTLLNRISLEFKPFQIYPLNCNDTVRMSRYEAGLPDEEIPQIRDAGRGTLYEIYEVTRGHPQAIKVLIGQMRLVDPMTALQNLAQGIGLDVGNMYLNIYEGAWGALSPIAKQILRKFGAGSSDEGILASTLKQVFNNNQELTEGLQELYQRKLIMVDRLGTDPLYSVHQITRNYVRLVIQKVGNGGAFEL
ncbi:MAG: hypothetical protein BroJett018_21000 [Chloroflexota bacterium]|nr:hypothetical protein [Chloroflexota bacterium]NOG65393.1 hypothetical protein [Chloroflexota bacterium]GIK64306.1 MAG: hypothetical protein BroJett018_21000 [Chloroflexota bacterium]